MPQPITSSLDPDYFWNFVTFSVENRLFRVPTYRFIEESDHFSTAHDMDILEQDCGLAYAHMHAIELDANLVDFQAFLKVLYPRDRATREQTSLTQEEWISVLKLSSEWFFRNLRERALREIGDLPVAQRISLAERCSIPTWLESGYTELVTREETISLEDAESIGLRNVIRLYEVRDRYVRQVLTPEDLACALRTTFAHALDKMHEANDRHLATKFVLPIEAPQDGPKEASPSTENDLCFLQKLKSAYDERSRNSGEPRDEGGCQGEAEDVDEEETF